MSITRGRDGYVNGIPCITSWMVSKSAAVTPYQASCTGRGTGITRGVINEIGTISGIGGNPPITPGTEFTFKGVIDNSVGFVKVLDGTVLPTSLTINIPKETGGNINWTAAFGVQGQLVEGAVGAADTSFVLHEGASLAADPVLDNAGDPYTIPGFRDCSFTIDCPEATYVISNAMYRKPGNLSANVTFNIYNDDYIDAKFAPNVVDKVKIYIDATTFWLFEWLRFTDIGNFTIDRATQAIIGHSIGAQWTAVNAATEGSIVRPGGAFLFGS
jgi:hypothetical protein